MDKRFSTSKAVMEDFVKDWDSLTDEEQNEIYEKIRKETRIAEVAMHPTDEVAEELNLAPRSVRDYARRHGIGQKIGRDWLFSEMDIERLQKRPKKGRPPKRPDI